MEVAHKLYAYVSQDEKTITTWDGQHIATVLSQGPLKKMRSQWISPGFRHIRCQTPDGKRYHGRSFGGGICITLRELKAQ